LKTDFAQAIAQYTPLAAGIKKNMIPPCKYSIMVSSGAIDICDP
jgi:hypothetical protein